MPTKTPTAPAKKPSAALMKPLTPSKELAAIVGKAPLPRTEVVKKVWDHIRAHSLQDPADKRTILADDKLCGSSLLMSTQLHYRVHLVVFFVTSC